MAIVKHTDVSFGMANDDLPNSANGTPLAATLKRYRGDIDISQAELARRTGLSRAYISELESGLGKRPSGDVLLRIAEALGVTIADLLDRQIRARKGSNVPDGLREFANQRSLPESDVAMLASIQFRGDQPRTARRWSMIYDTIQMSQAFDDDDRA